MLKPYLMLTRSGLKAFFRDRQGVFWSFFFPIVFVVLFGSIFSRSDNGPEITFDVGLVLQDPSPEVTWVPSVFEQIKVLKIHQGTLDEEKSALLEGKRHAIMVFPADFARKMMAHDTTDVKVYYDPSRPQMAQGVQSVLGNVLAHMDRGMAAGMNAPPPMVQMAAEPLSAGGSTNKPLRGIDFTLPGILAMSVMQLGLFTAIPLVIMRERGILKRLRATPVPRSAIVGSQVTMRLIIGVVQTLTLIGIGLAFFHFHMMGSWPALLGLVVFGALTFIGIGAILSAVAKTQESVIPMVQLVNFPMMFLSGMFIPLEILPDGMKPFVNILPATHLTNLMRHLMVQAPALPSVTTSLLVMGAWLVGGLALASRMFRWE